MFQTTHKVNQGDCKLIFKRTGCPACGNPADTNCEVVLFWKKRDEVRGSIHLCIECWDNLQMVANK